MESDSETNLSDKVTSTASENRKSSKPIMEKRRRARINASLAELKSLLLEVMKKEGARQNKLEKADILEITVTHLRQLQKQQYSALAASDPTMINKYRLGFNECASEVGKFLESMVSVETEARAKILNHLANCIVSCEPPSPTKPTECVNSIRNEQPTIVTSSPPAFKILGSNEFIMQNTRQQETCPPKPIISSGTYLNSTCTHQAPVQNILNNAVTTCLPAASTSLPVQSLVAGQTVHLQSSQLNAQSTFTISPQNQIQTHAIPQQPAQVQVPKLVSGVQLIPTKMSTGEMAFIIPANLLANTAPQNYVIPVLPPQPVTMIQQQQQQQHQITSHTIATVSELGPKEIAMNNEVPVGSIPTLSSSVSHQTSVMEADSSNSTFPLRPVVISPGLQSRKSTKDNITVVKDDIPTGSAFRTCAADSNQIHYSSTSRTSETQRSSGDVTRPNNQRSNNNVFDAKDESMWRPW